MRKVLSCPPYALQTVIFSKESSICFSCLVGVCLPCEVSEVEHLSVLCYGGESAVNGRGGEITVKNKTKYISFSDPTDAQFTLMAANPILPSFWIQAQIWPARILPTIRGTWHRWKVIEEAPVSWTKYHLQKVIYFTFEWNSRLPMVASILISCLEWPVTRIMFLEKKMIDFQLKKELQIFLSLFF